MTLIRKDEKGICAYVGGYTARPTSDTRYTVGQKIKMIHFGGSQLIGVDKLPGRGQYVEYWHTDGWSPEVAKVFENKNNV
jgi:hypothetical protein